MPNGVAVTLPHGVRVGGEWTRDVRLRPLNGSDEAYLADEAGDLLPAERTTGLLARCVERIGSAAASTDMVQALTVGDREALLLQIRRLTFGDKLEAVLACPSAECEERMDLELTVGDLILEPYAHATEWHEAAVVKGESQYVVRYRCPTGQDQEDAARLASNLRTAAALVLGRCVAQVGSAEGHPVDGLPDDVAQALPSLMVARDPQAEIVLALACPACGTEFRVLFDAGDYLCRELVAYREGLFQEVHHLALHYHWSEAEIMGLPTAKRRRYLELLADALEGGAR